MSDVAPDGYLTREAAARRIARGDVIHAALGGPGIQPLCGGRAAIGMGAILDLTRPEAGALRGTVNCQGCLEWMHA